MKYLPYIIKHLKHSWLRTVTTVTALALCVFLICTLQTIVEGLEWGLESASDGRLIVKHRESLTFRLPVAYRSRIAAVPGVKRVAASVWFGGSRDLSVKDFKDFFANFAVDAEPYFAMYPEYQVPTEQMLAFMQRQRGAIVGAKTAEKFGWELGDLIQLESFLTPYRKDEPFEFIVLGIYTVDLDRYPGTDETLMFFHFDYLYEGTQHRSGVVTYAVQLEDPNQAGEVSAAIDALFENSEARTRTETERAFRASFVSLSGNLAALLNTIGLAVGFSILLVTANTMSMAIRERRTEIAVLKTLGFGSGLVMLLILGEALLLAAVGGGLGVLGSSFIIGNLKNLPGISDALRGFPGLTLSPGIAGLGLGIALALGLCAGIVPATLAYRSRITDALRGF